MIGKLWISPSIWHQAIEVWRILPPARILRTRWNRNVSLIWELVISYRLWVYDFFWSVALSYLSAWAAQDSKGNSNFVGLKRKWAHAQLVPGRVYLTPKGGDPRPPVLPPTSTTHNRLLTKLNKRIVMWLKYINMRIGFCGHFPYDSGLFLGCGAVWRHWIQTQQRNEESFRRRLILFCFDK